MNSENTRIAEAILDSFKFKRQKRIKTEEALEGNKLKIVDLSDIPPLEGDGVKILDLSDILPLEADEVKS